MATKKEENGQTAGLTLKQKLSAIQTKIKAPKNLYNSFGKYNYRNAESILEAVKPYLDSLNLYLTIHDEIENIGDRFYVKAVVELGDCETDEYITTYAYAREESEKKGMDGSQVTGATSSYARKYALNGLFLLDDTKDADTDEYHNVTAKAEAKAKPQPVKEASEEDFKAELKDLWNKASDGADGFEDWYKKNTAKGFNTGIYAGMKASLMKQISKKEEESK